MEISMDGTDPAGWDTALDGVLAAPANHEVLFEDDAIRVVSVTVRPGETEKPHHHRWPSVFVVDRMVTTLRDYDGATGEEIPLPIPDAIELPLVLRFPPQPLHYVENFGPEPFHATRIEFKHGYPASL